MPFGAVAVVTNVRLLQLRIAPHSVLSILAIAPPPLSLRISRPTLIATLTGSSFFLDIAAQISSTASSNVAYFASTCAKTCIRYKASRSRFSWTNQLSRVYALQHYNSSKPSGGDLERGTKKETNTYISRTLADLVHGLFSLSS